MKTDYKKQYLFHTKEGRRNLALSIIAVLLGVLFLFPIYWMLQISFKSDMETFGKVFSATVEATGDELIHIGSRDERINSYLEDLEWDEYPMSLYLSGWYRCDGA